MLTAVASMARGGHGGHRRQILRARSGLGSLTRRCSDALLRRRGRLLAARRAPARRRSSAPPVVAFGGSADVVVYNGRSQYGDEQAFTRLREARPASRSSCAAAPRPSCSSACAARATTRPPTCSSPPTSRTSGAPRRPGCSQPVTHAGARAPGPGASYRDPDGALVGPEPAHPHADALDRARRRGRDRRATRTSATPQFKRQALPAHLEQRVQPVARRRPDRQARRGRHRAAAALAGWPTTRRSSAPTSTCSRRSTPAAATSA